MKIKLECSYCDASVVVEEADWPKGWMRIKVRGIKTIACPTCDKKIREQLGLSPKAKEG